ncbi:MAG: hypothetical protein EXR65_01315 [Dehalococcoidia bacterium]|nr:hypothetical protein [Dehalococcoidia bacterium]
MIITLTLNPAIDEMVDVGRLIYGDTNRVLAIRRDIGGKGINVARVLKELGFEPVATGFVAGHLGRMIEDSLQDLGIGTELISFPGETRTNIHIIDRSSHTLTVLATAGPQVPPQAVALLCERLRRRVRAGDWLVLAGSIPPPLDPSLHIELIGAAAAARALTALDADGPVVEAVLRSDARPTLLKLNDHEAGRVLHRPLPGEEDALEAARELHMRGVPNVVITRGAYGAVAVTEAGVFRVLAPPVEVDSSIGAGDGFLAGLLLGLKREGDWRAALTLACAAGSAVCMTPGTALCRAADVAMLRRDVRVEPVLEPTHVW